MAVHVVRDQDATCSGGDFVRVHCRRQSDSALAFTTIERVYGNTPHACGWRFRTLVRHALMDAELATGLARAYAERKNIPVVYVEIDQAPSPRLRSAR